MSANAGDAAQHEAGRAHGGIADRLWPVLLDRLTDLEPDRQKEAPHARVMSRKAYRDGVLRDLEWLLNTTNLEASIDFSAHPDAQRSVVNFGLVALSGRIASSVDTAQLEASIRQAIVQFEPRILPQTLDVKVAAGEKGLDMHNVLAVTIRGELWSIPYPLEILLRSDIDLETGLVVLHDQSRGD
ncbi:MAG: type VI secretion system baseplate subunit TssE [Rudaea sp.]